MLEVKCGSFKQMQVINTDQEWLSSTVTVQLNMVQYLIFLKGINVTDLWPHISDSGISQTQSKPLKWKCLCC